MIRRDTDAESSSECSHPPASSPPSGLWIAADGSRSLGKGNGRVLISGCIRAVELASFSRGLPTA